MKKYPVDSAASLESVIHELIPISVAMGIRVDSYDAGRLVLSAPLSNNINHQQSAFGGSLFSVAALAGWGILQLALDARAIDGNIVIANGDVSYRRPVFEDFRCVCELPDTMPDFFTRLSEEGKAGLVLTPRIEVGGKTAMTVTGNYFVSLAL